MSDQQPHLRPERILELTRSLDKTAEQKIGEIASVNRVAKMLSINAMVVAARTGEAGRSFAVVAEEFRRLSGEIDIVAAALESELRNDLRELNNVGGGVIGHLRGQRLADLAMNAIEIIDRNLYERTCDVRWWATDAAVVDCLSDPTVSRCQEASRRLGVILSAYTVYLDLWICDRSGRVVASGRPDRYPAARRASVAGTSWFKAAMGLQSGDDFSASDIECLPALNNAPVATYATAVRAGGATNGKILGVLGIHFDWEPQAKAVVTGVRLSAEERQRSRVMILDRNSRILASSDGKGFLDETVALRRGENDIGSYADGNVTIGYAVTPGYETYRGMGWLGCIMQTI